MSLMWIFLHLAHFLLGLSHCEASREDEQGLLCAFPTPWSGPVLSINITKRGFHRELLYEVQHDPTPHVLKALLIQKVPSGLYMDQYQLASLNDDTGLEVLLDSAVNLEDPAYVSSGFSALVFLRPVLPGRLQAAVPVHGRYHRPSSSGGLEQVTIERPRLLLQLEGCETLPSGVPHSVVEAPCTVHNQSQCSWLEIQGLQAPDYVTLQLPVGDFSMTGPVCAGTLLATLLCFTLLFRSIWKHGIF